MAKFERAATYREHHQQLDAARADLPPLVVIEGAEPFFRRAALTALRAAYHEKYPQIAETMLYGAAEARAGKDARLDPAALFGELSSADLFGGEKLLIARNAQNDFFPQKITDADAWNEVAEALRQPLSGIFCLLELEKINSTRVLGKALAGAAIIPCPQLATERDVEDWLRGQVASRGKTITPDALGLLNACYGADLTALAAEIEKCALYLGAATAEITAELVRQFLPDQQDFNRFALTNALDKRDLRAAMHYARLTTEQGLRDEKGRLQSGADAAHATLGMIANRFEKLTRVAALKTTNPLVITQKLGISPGEARFIVATAQKFTLPELLAILEKIADEIHSAHDTGSDAVASVENLVLKICRAGRGAARG